MRPHRAFWNVEVEQERRGASRSTAPASSSKTTREERALFVPLTVRIRGEYREMPGLRLTLRQAARVWQLERSACEAVLMALVDEGFLTRTRDGAYISTRGSES